MKLPTNLLVLIKGTLVGVAMSAVLTVIYGPAFLTGGLFAASNVALLAFGFGLSFGGGRSPWLGAALAAKAIFNVVIAWVVIGPLRQPALKVAIGYAIVLTATIAAAYVGRRAQLTPHEVK